MLNAMTSMERGSSKSGDTGDEAEGVPGRLRAVEKTATG